MEFVNLQISEMDFGGQSQKYNTIFFGWYYEPDMQSDAQKTIQSILQHMWHVLYVVR